MRHRGRGSMPPVQCHRNKRYIFTTERAIVVLSGCKIDRDNLSCIWNIIERCKHNTGCFNPRFSRRVPKRRTSKLLRPWKIFAPPRTRHLLPKCFCSRRTNVVKKNYFCPPPYGEIFSLFFSSTFLFTDSVLKRNRYVETYGIRYRRVYRSQTDRTSIESVYVKTYESWLIVIDRAIDRSATLTLSARASII